MPHEPSKSGRLRITLALATAVLVPVCVAGCGHPATDQDSAAASSDSAYSSMMSAMSYDSAAIATSVSTSANGASS